MLQIDTLVQKLSDEEEVLVNNSNDETVLDGSASDDSFWVAENFDSA